MVSCTPNTTFQDCEEHRTQTEHREQNPENRTPTTKNTEHEEYEEHEEHKDLEEHEEHEEHEGHRREKQKAKEESGRHTQTHTSNQEQAHKKKSAARKYFHMYRF